MPLTDENDSKGEKITAKAHNGMIEIEGVTVAKVDDQVRLQKVETWFDPLEMFRQIAPNGIVNKEVRNMAFTKDDQEENTDVSETEGKKFAEEKDSQETTGSELNKEPKSNLKNEAAHEVKEEASGGTNTKLNEVSTTSGNAIAEASDSQETQRVHEEMSKISVAECPFLMNKE